MRRNAGVAVLEPTDAACVRAFSVMNYNCAHFFGALAEIAFRCGVPNRLRIVGIARNAQFWRGEQVVMLGKNRLQVDVVFRETELLCLLGIV